MSTPVILKYPLDLTGTQESNLVQGEITRVPRTTGRHFAPMEGPFFENSLVLHTVPENRLLVKDVDYRCVYLYEYASVKAGQAVVAVVSIINPEIYGDLRYDYQVIGGEFSTNVTAIQLLIENLALDDRVVSWDNILDRPVTFPPSPHLHDVGDWYGMEAVVAAIEQLIDAILVGSQDLYDQLNVRFDSLFAMYQAQQTTISQHHNRLNALESHANGIDVTFAQFLQRVTDFEAFVTQFIRYQVFSTPITLVANRRYMALSNSAITLPTTVGLTAGDAIELELLSDLTPVVTVFNTTTQRIRRRGVEDTQLTYDGIRPRLTFIYIGGNIWEVRI